MGAYTHTQTQTLQTKNFRQLVELYIYILGLRFDCWENVASLPACLFFNWICLFNGRKYCLAAGWFLVRWVSSLMESMRRFKRHLFPLATGLNCHQAEKNSWREMGNIQFEWLCGHLRQAVEDSLAQKQLHLPALWLHDQGMLGRQRLRDKVIGAGWEG